MRGAGFGLVGLLIVGGIIFWLTWGGPGTNGGYVRTELEAREKATNELNAVGGKDSNGTPVNETISYTVFPNKYINVDAIQPDSPFVTKYGMKVGDEILELGPLTVKDQVTGDADAKGYLMQAFQRSDPIVVLRGDKKLTLPDDKNTPAANPASPQAQAQPAPVPAATPDQPGPPPQPKRQNINGAVHDLVNQIETH